MKVSEYIVGLIADTKTEYIFGYQGGSVADIINAICHDDRVDYIQAYNEQGAGFAANAYARLSGKLGVCIVTNGPGLTNVVSAVADAYCDFVPVLIISGQVSTIDKKDSDLIRQNGFQEINSEKLLESITKYSRTVLEVDEIKNEIQKAINIATTPPYGPVLIDIPINLQKMDIIPDKIGQSVENIVDSGDEIDYNQVLCAIEESKKPVIIAGGGVRQSGAYNELREFAALTHIPVVRTLAGLDLMTDNDIGFAGLYGEINANLAVHNADLLIVLGSRLSKRQVGIPSIYGSNAKLMHVDINQAELGHVRAEDYSYKQDVHRFLQSLIIQIKQNNIIKDFKSWNEEINQFTATHADDVDMNSSHKLSPIVFLRELSKQLKEDAVITLDVGQNQMWCAQGIKPRKGNRIISSCGLGCMGFSLPAAIGAYYAKKQVIYAFMGDGGSQMNIQELQLISDRRVPIKVFIFNNSGLGMIQEVQMKFANQEYYGTKIGYAAPDYKKIANAYGIDYQLVEKNDQVSCDSFLSVLEEEKPTLIELKLDGNPMRLLTMYDNIEVYQ